MRLSTKTLAETAADLARPYVLFSTSSATAFAIVRIAWDRIHLNEGAAFIGAALFGLATLYGAKAIEETRKSGHTADVKKEEVKANVGATQTQSGTDPAASGGQPVPSATVTTTLSVPGGGDTAAGAVEVDAAPS